jgi:hypothetical protein
MSIGRIAIYLAPGEQLAPMYLLHFICERWRDAGIDVILLDSPEQRADADVALVHVDATHRPADYEAVLEHYPRVINGRVRDISKRRISGQLVTRFSEYDGPVIVKTNRNSFGHPEQRCQARAGTRRTLYSRVVDRLLPAMAQIRGKGAYPVYSSVREVPARVWWDRRLVVEKFLPERDGDLYCLRNWTFFGDRELVTRSFSESPIVKRPTTLRHQVITEVPDAIRAVRRKLGFDYGKFDFVIHDGQPVLLDTNATPGCSGQRSEKLDAFAEELAGGLFAMPLAMARTG